MQSHLRHLRDALFIALGLLCGPAIAATAPITVRDDSGNVLRLQAPARRIVSLSPHGTELLFAAGAGARVVGVDQASNFPAATHDIVRIGRIGAYDVERIVSLRPDLAVGWHSGTPSSLIERLRATGIPVYLSEPRELEEIATNLERLGLITGHANEARMAAAHFRTRMRSLHARHAHRPSVSVFYQVWGQPLTTVGGKQIISRSIGLCGATNVFASLPGLAPVVSREAVMRADPEALVASSEEPAPFEAWQNFGAMRALRLGNLLKVNGDLMNRPTPRMLDGLEDLCVQIEAVRHRRTQPPDQTGTK